MPQVVESSASGNAPPAIGAAFGRSPRPLITVDSGHIGRPGQREITTVGAIGSFAEILPRYDFRNEAVEIEISLAMAVRAQVHLHTVDVGREIRPVIEIEAAQEILVRLAAPGMLGSHHPRNRFQKLGHAKQRTHEQIGACDAIPRFVTRP